MRKKSKETGIEYVFNGIRQPSIRRKRMKQAMGNRGNKLQRLTPFYLKLEKQIESIKTIPTSVQGERSIRN